MADSNQPSNEIPLPPAPQAPRRAPASLPSPTLVPRERSSDEVRVPPLFIKIDKYKDIVQNLQRLKSYALSLRDALDALNDIEKEFKTGIQLTQKALDDFNAIIALLDAKLIRLSEGDEGGTSESEEVPEHMDSYIKGVYDQIEKIRNELKTISSA